MAQMGFGGGTFGSLAASAFSRLRGGGFDPGNAVRDLGLGGALRDQVGTETEEQRKKRMQDMGSLMGSMGSLANYNLFGARGGPLS